MFGTQTQILFFHEAHIEEADLDLFCKLECSGNTAQNIYCDHMWGRYRDFKLAFAFGFLNKLSRVESHGLCKGFLRE